VSFTHLQPLLCFLLCLLVFLLDADSLPQFLHGLVAAVFQFSTDVFAFSLQHKPTRTGNVFLQWSPARDELPTRVVGTAFAVWLRERDGRELNLVREGPRINNFLCG